MLFRIVAAIVCLNITFVNAFVGLANMRHQVVI